MALALRPKFLALSIMALVLVAVLGLRPKHALGKLVELILHNNISFQGLVVVVTNLISAVMSPVIPVAM